MSLERGNAGEKFKLRARAEEFASNLSLEAYLDRVHGIRLPTFEATEQFDYTAYVEDAAEAVASKPGWEALPDDIMLGFFSFAKFLMYCDLDPANWPASGRISERPLVRGLLSEGFEADAAMTPEDAPIDPHIPRAEMLHIVDSDSSQALVVHEVRNGRDLVVQGPPGTGKSQTIANIVAAAVADGRTVLFVAEKMAALEVVKRRLDANGVGDACLELHSNKANKRALLEELRRTWELGAPRAQEPGTLNARLAKARDRLNGHAARMHAPHGSAGLTPFQVIGHLTRLRSDGRQPNDMRLDAPERWTRDGLLERREVLGELVERIEAIGVPAEHPWRGVGLESILPTDVERLSGRVAELGGRLSSLRDAGAALAAELGLDTAERLADLGVAFALAERLAGTPDLAREALASDVWDGSPEAVARLLEVGGEHAAARAELGPAFREGAWSADLSAYIPTLSRLPSDGLGQRRRGLAAAAPADRRWRCAGGQPRPRRARRSRGARLPDRGRRPGRGGAARQPGSLRRGPLGQWCRAGRRPRVRRCGARGGADADRRRPLGRGLGRRSRVKPIRSLHRKMRRKAARAGIACTAGSL